MKSSNLLIVEDSRTMVNANKVDCGKESLTFKLNTFLFFDCDSSCLLVAYLFLNVLQQSLFGLFSKCTHMTTNHVHGVRFGDN